MKQFIDILNHGCWMHTSGTTGASKPVWQSRDRILAANDAARDLQGIDRHSRVLTVCDIEHAGGLLAQTLPAYEIGAHTDIAKFNPRTYMTDIRLYTHSHLTPRMARAIMKTRSFKDHSLVGRTITCGSEPVTSDIIRAFTERGATFIANWGMTECGPVAISQVYDRHTDIVDDVRGLTVMGDQTFVDWTTAEGQLWVRGDICSYTGWYPTGDRVEVIDGVMYYSGRTTDIQQP